MAIVVSVFTYKHGVNRERSRETIRRLGEVRAECPETLGLDDDGKKGYLSKMEYFCTGSNEKIYDVKIVGRMSDSRLIGQHDKWGKVYVARRREASGNVNLYCEYEATIGKLKRLKR